MPLSYHELDCTREGPYATRRGAVGEVRVRLVLWVWMPLLRAHSRPPVSPRSATSRIPSVATTETDTLGVLRPARCRDPEERSWGVR